MAQQQMPTDQQRVIQGQNITYSAFSKYDPQFALFTFEKQRGDEGWEDVEAEQQHVNAQDLQNDVKKFQRSKITVKRKMEEITSSNARRVINELVEEQNQILMAINRTLRWTIASIDIKWKTINRTKKQLQRVSVILQTEASGYEDPNTVRAPAAAPIGAKAQAAQQSRPFELQPHYEGPEIPQLLRNPPPATAQPAMGHQQPPGPPTQMPQSHGRPNFGHGPPPPPPPPPPPGASSFHQHQHPPPPPPPGAANLAHPPLPPPITAPNLPCHPQQQPRAIPGAFPGANARSDIRHGQPTVNVHNPSILRKPKKHENHHDELSSESDLGSDDWESETGDSASDHLRVRHVERGEFAHIGKPKRGRSRQSSRSKKSQHNRSMSKIRSRSRSRARTETYRKRPEPIWIDPPPMGKYSPVSSKNSSPRSSKQHIHIHMNTGATEPSRTDERTRRDSHSASSPDYRKDKFAAEPMSRVNSWDRYSGTNSFNDNSSVHTADDSVFSEPECHGRRSRHHSDILEHSPKLRSRNLPPRQNGMGYPHPSHIYGDVETRPRRSAYPPTNDYPRDPRQRDAYFNEPVYTPRPGVPRRNSVQTPPSNPFDTMRYPPRLPRSNTYAPELQDPLYGQREQHYLSDRPAQDGVNLEDLADAIAQLKEKRRPLQGRRASEYGRVNDYGGYDGYDRRMY
ncbi:hypothetical protein G6514_001590 [Epicoccum nigrum]|nr:hypothetical protein G6514_001590 [Epicoccum nigrum]